MYCFVFGCIVTDVILVQFTVSGHKMLRIVDIDYHPQSGMVYNFGPVCLSVNSLDVGSSFSLILYIPREYGSRLYMKVIESGSRSRDQKMLKILIPAM